MSFMQTPIPWILLMIALAGDFIVPYILAAFHPGYSHKKDVMSVLGSPESPVSRIYNIWLVILGILICLSSIRVYIEYQSLSRFYSSAIQITMFSFGIGAGVLAGMFSVDADEGVESAASKIHGIGAGIGFMLLTFVPLIIGLLSLKEGSSGFGIFSIIMFIISLALFVLFVMSERESYKDSVIGLSGLWQRLLLASMYLPLFLLACGKL